MNVVSVRFEGFEFRVGFDRRNLKIRKLLTNAVSNATVDADIRPAKSTFPPLFVVHTRVILDTGSKVCFCSLVRKSIPKP